MPAPTATNTAPVAAPVVNEAAAYAEKMPKNDALALAKQHYPHLSGFAHSSDSVSAVNDLGQTVIIPTEVLAKHALGTR